MGFSFLFNFILYFYVLFYFFNIFLLFFSCHKLFLYKSWFPDQCLYWTPEYLMSGSLYLYMFLVPFLELFFPSACFVFDVLVFILLYYILFYHFPLEAWFLMRDIKGVNLNGRLYREALGRVEGRETIIMIYHMRTKSLFNKMKNRKSELLKFEEITWDNKNNSIIIIQFQFRYMF